MNKSVNLLLISIFLYSCQGESEYRPRFRADSCIKEINRSFASVDNPVGSVYKLEDIIKKESGPQIKVSFWHNNSWFYQGVKNYNHFKDTHLFSYENVDCPDGSSMKKGITDKLKKINL